MAVPNSVPVLNLLSHGPHRYETGRKQVTLALGGLYIASTTVSAKPMLVWETEKGYARYYIPTEALHADIKGLLNDPVAVGDDGNTVSQVPVGLNLVEIVSATENESKAAIEKLTVGNKSTSWVRFLEGPFKDFIRFERQEIGKSPFPTYPKFFSCHNITRQVDQLSGL